MADAAPYLEEVAYTLRCHELSYLSVIFRMARRRWRNGMVQRDRQALRVFHALVWEFGENASDGSRVIMAQYNVWFHIQHIPSTGTWNACLFCKYFLGKGESTHHSYLCLLANWELLYSHCCVVQNLIDIVHADLAIVREGLHLCCGGAEFVVLQG